MLKRRYISPYRLCGILFFLLLFGAAAHAAQEGDSAPDFSLKTLDGREVSLGDYRGKFVLINFWATWCVPCKVEMPSLEKLYQRFKSKNFAMLAISNDMFGEKVVRPYIEVQNFTFTVLLDPILKVSNRFGVVSLPTTFLIGPDGKIIGVLGGAEDWASSDNINFFENLLADDAGQKAEDREAKDQEAPKENPRQNPLEAEMAWIPPGIFLFGTDQQDKAGEAIAMGLPKPWYADETPRQNTFLKGFYIDRYEVTNRRYKVYVDDVGAIPPANWQDGDFAEDREDFPVVWVNWFDATNFCQWAGKRLPTEKEWERTARGLKGRQYPWGNTFNIEYANLAKKAGRKTVLAKVGSHPQSAGPEEVHDLIGNVWEWTQNDYAPYKGNLYQTTDYDAGYKTLRGASAAYIGHFPGGAYIEVLKKYARSGYRQPAAPDDGAEDVGFRCVSQKKPEAMKLAAAGNVPPTEATGDPANLTNAAEKSSLNSTDPALLKLFAAEPKLPQSGMLILILLAFIAGILSFLSPCTLPILPAYFAVTAQVDRARMSLMSVAFFCGLASLFVMMGASASFAGRVLRDYLFSLTTIGGVFVVIFGIMTLAGKGFSGASFQNKPTNTFVGFFLFGGTFALGWTPCVGPVLSGILILAASDKTIFQGMSLLFFYAVGLGLPLIIISAFFSHLSRDSLFWRILRGKGWEVNIGGRTLLLHSTNLFSGLLLIALGVALAMGYLTYLNSLIPLDTQIWFVEFEEKILDWFM